MTEETQETIPDAVEDGVKEAEEEAKPKSTSIIETAQLAAESLKIENDRKENLLNQERELMAKKLVSGETYAGQAPTPKVELTDEQLAEKFQNGEIKDLFK